MQAMLLAAGLGTRLKPITDWLPKPLFPVLNEPCLKRHIKSLIKSGFNKIIINSYHLADIIENSLQEWNFNDIEIILLKENTLLGTGGGIRNALDYIDRHRPLLVINSDIITDISPALILKKHLETNCVVTLITHNCDRHRALRIEDNLVKEFNYKEKNAMAYTGICVLGSEFIETIPKGEMFCLIKAFKNFIEAKGFINSIPAISLKEDYLWEDIGTPQAYLNIHKILLERDNISIFTDKNTILPEDIKIKGWGCFGKKITIGQNVSVKDSVVWDNTVIPDNADINNTIFHQN